MAGIEVSHDDLLDVVASGGVVKSSIVAEDVSQGFLIFFPQVVDVGNPYPRPRSLWLPDLRLSFKQRVSLVHKVLL